MYFIQIPTVLCNMNFYLLPNKNVMNDSSAAENDAKTDDNRRYDGRRRIEMKKRVQNNSCKKNVDKKLVTQISVC